MKRADFNNIYEYAKTVNVVTDEWLNLNAWIWLRLTDAQLKKMYALMLEQGAQEEERKGKTGIALAITNLFVQRVEERL